MNSKVESFSREIEASSDNPLAGCLPVFIRLGLFAIILFVPLPVGILVFSLLTGN